MDDEQPRNDEEGAEGFERALVPIHSPIDVSRGIQAFRRGEMILYTVRGEPEQVKELISELDKRGVNEIVAFVSHRRGDAKPLEEPPAEEPPPGEED
jgi:hypothetical protein